MADFPLDKKKDNFRACKWDTRKQIGENSTPKVCLPYNMAGHTSREGFRCYQDVLSHITVVTDEPVLGS